MIAKLNLTTAVSTAIILFSQQTSYAQFIPVEKPAGPEYEEPLDECQQKLVDFVNSDTLPADMWPSQGHYETMGFEFKQLLGEDMVYPGSWLVTLPRGWTRTISEDMNNAYIIDEREDERVRVYCGDNQETELVAIMLPRYSVEYHYHAEGVEIFARDLQGNYIINYCGDGKVKEDGTYPDMSEVIRECEAWLEENYPGNEDPLGYWDH